jgi:hypothetical protein
MCLMALNSRLGINQGLSQAGHSHYVFFHRGFGNAVGEACAVGQGEWSKQVHIGWRAELAQV